MAKLVRRPRCGNARMRKKYPEGTNTTPRLARLLLRGARMYARETRALGAILRAKFDRE